MSKVIELFLIPAPRFSEKAKYIQHPIGINITNNGQMKKINQFAVVIALAVGTAGLVIAEKGNEEKPENQGIAWLYPGDEGIENHLDVVFVENFETGNMKEIESRWGHMSNREGKVMSFSNDVPEGSAGTRSLKMTATRGENEGGELYKTFHPGWDKIYLRFYVKFTKDHGYQGHFVAVRGAKKPTPYPMGGAGQRPENEFSITMEPKTHNVNEPGAEEYVPPGVWQFYAYWPEMHSWQTFDGKPDGRPNPYYGNVFQPRNPAFALRGEWTAVEIMVKLNSSPEDKDGELAFWINGKSAAYFGPGNPKGYWRSGSFHNDPNNKNAAPFEGFRWRHDMDVKVNVLRLQHYMSDRTFSNSQDYADKHPNHLIDAKQTVVYFDNVVMAKKYIGPMRKK